MTQGFYEAMLSDVVATDWAKVAAKHYKHKSGIQVKYNHNKWKWEVIGGAKCGYMYDVKWAAQTEAVK